MSKPPNIVSNGEVDRALAFLRDSALKIGAAKQRCKEAEARVKAVEAIMFKASDEKAVEAKKHDARTTKEWTDATTEDAIAAGKFEELKALREAAGALIEAWRSEQANYRAMKI